MKKEIIETINQAISACNRMVDEVNNQNEKATQSFTDAANLFRKDITQKETLINKKKEDLKAELKKLQDKETSLKNTYADIVTCGNEKDIKNLETDLQTIANDITFCNSKISMLNMHSEKGDKKLFDQVCEAYKSQKKAAIESKNKAVECSQLIIDTISKLTEFKKSFDYFDAANKDLNMVNVYETFNGSIDVTGYHAGSDQNAKMRFVSEKYSN